MISGARPNDKVTDDWSRIEFLGLNFDSCSEAEALEKIKTWVATPAFFYVITPNVDHVVALNRAQDPLLTNAYAHADMTLCDSRILSLLGRQSGLNVVAVPGSDLTRQLLNEENTSWRCAIIGGDAALHAHIARLYPQHTWIYHQPPMGVRRSPAARVKIAEFVEIASVDIVFFAIGAPQSEICCYELAERGRAQGVALCIGASLEFLTGAKKRAPLWMQQFSLEWLHRLGSEPRRLWRRYLVEGPRIFLIWRRWDKLKAVHHPDGYDSNQFGGQ